MLHRVTYWRCCYIAGKRTASLVVQIVWVDDSVLSVAAGAAAMLWPWCARRGPVWYLRTAPVRSQVRLAWETVFLTSIDHLQVIYAFCDAIQANVYRLQVFTDLS